MNFQIDPTGTLALSGILGIDSADALRDALLDCVRTQPAVLLDLSSVEASDACALQVLLAGRKDALALGKRFEFRFVSESVAATVEALGLSEDFQSVALPSQNVE